MSAHCHGHSVPAPEITPEQWTKIDSIIECYQNVPGNLMPVLQAVQEAVGCLPPAVQDRIAAGLNVPGSDIFGVMSFYSMYTWRPKGKYVIRFCESPPCHILDSDNLLEFTRAELGVPLNHTTKDGLFTLEKTACLGVCEVAPAMQINEVVHGNLTKDKIKQILADYRAGKAPEYKKLPYSTNDFRSYKQSPAELVLLSNVGVIDPEKIDDYVAKGGYSALKKVVTSMTPEAVVEEVKASGIRGRGGRRFPGRDEVVLYPAPGRAPEIPHLQPGRGRTGHHQRPLHRGRRPPQAAGGYGHCRVCGGGQQGLYLQPGGILSL